MNRQSISFIKRPAYSFGFVISTLIFSGSAAAEVYRCTDSNGAVSFTDSPCKTSSKSIAIETKPNIVSFSNEREEILRAENEKLKSQLINNTQQSVAAPPVSTTPQTQNSGAATMSGNEACKSARRDYEISASSIDKNPSLIRARESNMYIACGVAEPPRQLTNIQVDTQKGVRQNNRKYVQ